LKELSSGQDFKAMKLGCQMLIGHQLPLADYLLKPVQRLLKYPLLLSVQNFCCFPLVTIAEAVVQEMLKATPDGSKGHAELHRALTIMKEVAARINEVRMPLCLDTPDHTLSHPIMPFHSVSFLTSSSRSKLAMKWLTTSKISLIASQAMTASL
jgi:hypothetical protein